jgi:dephospho-CoA kinase
MKVIGLCGGSGSGKGCVCEIFKSFDIPSIDTDKVYRELTERGGACLEALCQAFGEEILTPSGALDRAILRKVVFEGKDCDEKRNLLNQISHKYILGRTDEILDEYRKEGKSGVIVDAPLLFESGYNKKCDVIIAVVAKEDIRIGRIVKRDGISAEDAKKRIGKQISDEELRLLSDHCIVNNGDFSELEKQVREISDLILNLKR